MKEISQAISVLLPTLYLAVIFIYGLLFFSKTKRFAKYTTAILGSLLVVHGIGILLRSLSLHMVPLASKSDALSFLAMCILLIYLILELTFKNKATGFIVLFLPFLLQSVSSITYNWDIVLNPLLQDSSFVIHVTMTLIGYTAISISAVYAIMYLMLNQNLKKHTLGPIFENLPPLMLLERMSIRSVKIGILLLGLGIFHGHLRANAVMGTFLPADPKVITMDLIWLAYSIGFVISYLRKWRGIRMAYLSLTGFSVLILANIILNVIQRSFHQFV